MAVPLDIGERLLGGAVQHVSLVGPEVAYRLPMPEMHGPKRFRAYQSASLDDAR
jgi:hypothetical protein